MPSTSPVERISGPSSGSTSWNMLKGNTASLTPKCGIGLLLQVQLRELLAQHDLRGDAGHGDVADLGDQRHGARGPRVGLQDVDHVAARWRTGCSSAPPRSARWRSCRVYSSIVSMCLGGMLIGGITQAESPEWMPASSMCSITAGTKASWPSAMASASASMAFSRNLSIRIGRSGETSTAAAT